MSGITFIQVICLFTFNFVIQTFFQTWFNSAFSLLRNGCPDPSTQEEDFPTRQGDHAWLSAALCVGEHWYVSLQWLPRRGSMEYLVVLLYWLSATSLLAYSRQSPGIRIRWNWTSVCRLSSETLGPKLRLPITVIMFATDVCMWTGTNGLMRSPRLDYSLHHKNNVVVMTTAAQGRLEFMNTLFSWRFYWFQKISDGNLYSRLNDWFCLPYECSGNFLHPKVKAFHHTILRAWYKKCWFR